MRACEECGGPLPEGAHLNRRRCASLRCARAADARARAARLARRHGVAVGDCIRCGETIDSTAAVAAVCSRCSRQHEHLLQGAPDVVELSPETQELLEEIRDSCRRARRMIEETRRVLLGLPRRPPTEPPERIDPWAGHVSSAGWDP